MNYVVICLLISFFLCYIVNWFSSVYSFSIAFTSLFGRLYKFLARELVEVLQWRVLMFCFPFSSLCEFVLLVRCVPRGLCCCADVLCCSIRFLSSVFCFVFDWYKLPYCYSLCVDFIPCSQWTFVLLILTVFKLFFSLSVHIHFVVVLCYARSLCPCCGFCL